MNTLEPEFKQLIDYHVHSNYSDGFSSPHEIFQASKEKGLRKICITDHFSYFKHSLDNSNLEEYFNSIKELNKENSSSTRIYVGLEIDLYSIESFETLIDTNHKWDLLLFEYVFLNTDWEKKFFEIIKFKKEYPDYKIGFAHSRFSSVSESKFDHVINKIKDYELIIELNTAYQNYKDPWFSYLDETIYYSIGSDAHILSQIGHVNQAFRFLKSKNIPMKQIIIL